jgi:ElaB/YqjD/DUF883 family membrane-anchored ribosome-binding protein
MEQAQTSSESFAAALKLLEDAAKQKKEELKTVMSNKYSNLRNLIMEGEGSLMKSLSTVKDQAFDAATHAKEVSVEKAREIAHDVDKNVHQNPWPYIAGTAVVGLLLGYILGRNRT